MPKPLSPYQNRPTGQDKPGSIEAWGLIEAAKRMANAIGRPEANQQEISETVRLNWRLWTIFQVSLLSEETKVPDEIRLNLLSLSDWIDRQTVAYLANPVAERDRVATFIEINRNIAAGIYEGHKAEAQLPEGVQPATAEAPVGLSGGGVVI